MPNSLLWVCLVAIWLFVLVPMVVKSRPTVRKTSDTALSTRVLHRGGRTMAKTKRRIASGRHPHDADWEPPVREYRKAATATAVKEAEETANAAETKTTVGETTVAEPAPVLKKVAVQAESKDVERPDADVVGEAADTESDTEEAATDVVEADVDSEEVADADVTDDADAEVAEADEDQADEDQFDDDVDDDAVDELDDDLDEDAEYEDDYDDAEYDEEADYDDDLDDDLEDDAAAPVGETESERRARRGGFDPEADRERSDKRYRFRQRVMAVFALLLVAALGAGVLLGTAGWAAAAVVAVALLGYLTFLRRAVRNEQRIRQQRMRRLARAKRQEEERREHPEEDPRADVPRRLRRPGAIVLEIDDEDPVFDHLPRYERVERVEHEPSYRRVVGQ